MSRYLNDVALHHLIDGLVKLSTESMEIALNNKVREFTHFKQTNILLMVF